MAALGLTAPIANATHVRNRSGRFLERHVWSPIRRHAIKTLVRCFLSLKPPSNTNAPSPKIPAPVRMASAMAVDPIPSQESITTPSELSNGPLPATVVLGELLGTGTFGEVFKGYDSETGEEFAVKILSKKRLGNDAASMEIMKQRIEHEVSMWCKLQSFPSAVRLKKFYEDEERVYFVQELCTGGSLEDLMNVRGYLSEVEVAEVMKTVLGLAAFCHERNVCLCDIKPANFILPSAVPGLNLNGHSQSFVKVVDFGSCEHVPEKGLRGQKGTPLYMAPEVKQTRYGVESDMWSAGVLMYYLLSGEMPFVGKPVKGMSPSSLDFYLQFGELKFDAPVWKDVSDDAKDLIKSMLERSPEKRITAKGAMTHDWMHHLTNSDWPVPAAPATLSDICPMDTSVRLVDQAS